MIIVPCVFFAFAVKAAHILIACRSSTLENWLREFDRFAPSINVQAYYGSQKEREGLRFELRNKAWDVLVTTYNLAQGDERDRKFFRKFEWIVRLLLVSSLGTNLIPSTIVLYI